MMPNRRATKTHAALIGRRCDDSMNLGLGYLQAALEAHGLRSQVHDLNRWEQLEPICDGVLAARPALVGLSLADGGSAILALGLGELLRQRGFQGHITCGGQFATLARQWLLSRYAWLDSVVRFAGEAPLVGLVQALEAGVDPALVPGLTTRAGDGQPASLLDPTPMTLVPRRGELPQLLGHAVAHVAATRGCRGRCAYCGPAALLAQERREARDLGLDRQAAARAGVGGVRRRELAAVCDELAGLYHDRDVRYAYFVDEHLLPYEETEALRYLRRLRRELQRRKVRQLGLGTMLRVDRVSVPLARAFADAGLVRVFLGLEFGTAREAQRFGRRGDALSRVPALLRALRQEGVATVSNLMLVHPYSTPETIRAGLALLSRLSPGLCEINQMMVYHGTALQARLAREGRLQGNPLRYHYTFDDPAVARFTELFWRLRAEALRDYSVVFRSHDAALALALAARLRPDQRDALEEPWRLLDAVSGQVTALYVRALGRALALTGASAAGDGQADLLIRETADEARALVVRLEALHAEVSAALGAPGRIFSPMRAAAATAIGFVIAGGLGLEVGCSQRPSPLNPPAGAPAVTAPVVTAPAVSAPATVDAGVAAPAQRGSVPSVLRRPLDAGACTDSVSQRQVAAVIKQVQAKLPCFNGYVGREQGKLKLSVATAGLWSFCRDPAARKRLRELEAAAAKAAAALPTRCVVHSSVKGGIAADQRRLDHRLRGRCGGGPMLNAIHGVQIVLDDRGRVVDVVARPGKTPAKRTLACVRKALAGLTFPCLGGLRVCPEYVIIE